MLLNPEKAKKADLEAEIELYREALGEGNDVAALDTLKTNADKAAEVERLRKEHGSPVRVDEAFLEENKSLVALTVKAGDELTIGEIVFFGDDELAQAREADITAGRIAALTEEIVALKPDFEFGAEGETTVEGLEKVLADLKSPAGEPTPTLGRSNTTTRTVPVKDVAADLVYEKKTVIRVSNTIAHGKSYKDVTCADGQTYRLTPEDFKRDVKPRE